MSRQIFDNVLSKEELGRLQLLMLSPEFPWYFNTSVTYNDDVRPEPNWFKFDHMVYKNYSPQSPLFNDISPLVKFIKPVSLVLIRAFLTTYTGSKVNQGMHTDQIIDDSNIKHMKTSVFYLNTNNGGTLFEDGQFVESVENRLVTFDIKERHAAITATDTQARVVINFNYF